MQSPRPSAPASEVQRHLMLAEPRRTEEFDPGLALDELRVRHLALEQQNEELRRARAHYVDLYERAPVGYCTLDERGSIVEANLGAAALLGLRPDIFIGCAFSHFVHAEGQLGWRRLLQAGERQAGELRVLREGGSPFWAQLVVEATRNEAGELERRVVMNDVSDRKAAEAARREAELRERASSVRDALPPDLAQNQRLASLGQLAGGVAHEINNPLAWVLSNVESLAEELPSIAANGDPAKRVLLDDLAQRARGALEGSRRIKTITRAVGTFARVAREVMEPVDLNRALETAATLVGAELKHRARLIKDLGPVPPVLATVGKLTHVFVHLLINAAQAITEGHVEDNIVTLRTWASDGQVFAEIFDTGRGIAPEKLTRIFAPGGTTAQAGWGLALCRDLMADFAGELSVTSVVGTGTRVLVRLDARPALLPPPPVPNLSTSAARGRILVVDDEVQIRTVVQRLLGRQHEIVTAESGQRAQVLIEAGDRFDVILCDLLMPQMSGMALHAWLAEFYPALARRVVFISAGAFTPHASAYLEKVDNLELHKPFDPAELMTLVARFVATPLAR